MRALASRVLPAALCGLALALAGAGGAAAETAWVKGEVRINLRLGPGTQYKIVRTLTTGDSVDVLERSSRWTKVRMPDGKQGWIPQGYLEPQAPPTVRLEQLENRVVELQGSLESTQSEAATLRTTNDELTGRDAEQRAEIERLSMEVLELTAGARWPEWITGASILVVGMIFGAILHRSSGRRPSTRIRI